jgi:hypothetical protein
MSTTSGTLLTSMPRRRAGEGAAKNGVAFAGAPTAMFGTNPIAAVLPDRDGPPFSIEMSLSEVATLTRAKGIPLGWATRQAGQSRHGPQSGARGLDAAGRQRERRTACLGGPNCWSRRSPAHGWALRSAQSLPMKGINPGSARLFWSSIRGRWRAARSTTHGYRGPARRHAAGRKCAPTRLSPPRSCPQGRAERPGSF